MMDSDGTPFRGRGRGRGGGRGRGRGGGDGGFRNVGRGRYSYPPTGREQRVHFNDSPTTSGRSGDMRSRINSKRSFTEGRGRGRGGHTSNFHGGRTIDEESQWFRIEIPHGESSGKEFLLRALNAELETPFTPINYHVEGTNTVFYVEGKDLAETLRSLSNRITKPDGFKVKIFVKPSTPPQTTLDEQLTTLMKDVMSKRYLPDTCYLDLSNFRKDEMFTSKELYVTLERKVFLEEAIKIIKENVPNLRILNLEGNRIKFLTPLASLKDSCTNIHAVNLSKNKIQDIRELDHLKGLENLDELWLKDNLSPAFKDKTSLIRLSIPFPFFLVTMV